MKKSPFIVSVILWALTANVWASDDDHTIIVAAEKHQVSIAQAKKLADETAVSVTGTIVRQTKHEHYELQDSSGTIVVDIDEKLAKSSQLKAGTKVKVIGEIDTHRYKPTDIDAVKVEIIR